MSGGAIPVRRCPGVPKLCSQPRPPPLSITDRPTANPTALTSVARLRSRAAMVGPAASTAHSDRYATPSATGSFTMAPRVQSTMANQRRGTLLPAPDRARASPLIRSAAATASRWAPAIRCTSTSGFAAIAMTTTARRDGAGHPGGDRDEDHHGDQRHDPQDEQRQHRASRRGGGLLDGDGDPAVGRARLPPARVDRGQEHTGPQAADHGVGRVQAAAGELTLRHVGIGVTAADDGADRERQRSTSRRSAQLASPSVAPRSRAATAATT